MSGFGSRKVSMGSERSGLTFVCGIKPCSTPVQRYKVRNVCHSDYVSNTMQMECVAILYATSLSDMLALISHRNIRQLDCALSYTLRLSLICPKNLNI